jgi:hypothetical protein
LSGIDNANDDHIIALKGYSGYSSAVKSKTQQSFLIKSSNYSPQSNDQIKAFQNTVKANFG